MGHIQVIVMQAYYMYIYSIMFIWCQYQSQKVL